MDDSEPRVIPFTRRTAKGPGGGNEPPGDDGPDEEPGELVAPGAVYATARGPRAPASLQFIRKDKRSFAVPYAYLPVLWWKPPGSLLIEYPGLFTVAIHGKELDDLYRLLAAQRLTWIREFDEHQAGCLSTAVTRIEILRVYPSHQANDGEA